MALTASQLSQIESQYGLPPGFLMGTYGIESGFGKNHGQGSSGVSGPFQLSDNVRRSYNEGVSGEMGDAIAAAGYGRANATMYRNKFGSDPTASDLYLMHQQGPGGGLALLAHPDQPAGSLVRPLNIQANGGDPKAPASSFTSHWADKVAHFSQGIGSAYTTAANKVGDVAHTVSQYPSDAYQAVKSYVAPPSVASAGQSGWVDSAGNHLNSPFGAVGYLNGSTPVDYTGKSTLGALATGLTHPIGVQGSQVAQNGGFLPTILGGVSHALGQLFGITPAEAATSMNHPAATQGVAQMGNVPASPSPNVQSDTVSAPAVPASPQPFTTGPLPSPILDGAMKHAFKPSDANGYAGDPNAPMGTIGTGATGAAPIFQSAYNGDNINTQPFGNYAGKSSAAVPVAAAATSMGPFGAGDARLVPIPQAPGQDTPAGNAAISKFFTPAARAPTPAPKGNVSFVDVVPSSQAQPSGAASGSSGMIPGSASILPSSGFSPFPKAPDPYNQLKTASGAATPTPSGAALPPAQNGGFASSLANLFGLSPSAPTVDPGMGGGLSDISFGW